MRGALRFGLAALVLAAAARPARGAPYLTPEFGMDNPTTGPSLQGYAAAGAFDGTNTFVVWEDARQGNHRIYGTRVDQAGKVLDPMGIALGTATAAEAAPSVAYGAGVFLVAWEQGTGSDVRVYVARVSTAGAVLDAAGIAVATGGFDEQYDPAVAFDGTNFLVTYSVGLSAGGQIAAVRIGPSGNRLDTTAITVSRITSPYAEAQGTPAVAFDGTNYLVVWQDDRGDWWDIYGNRVTPGGMVLDGNGFAVDATPVSGQNTPQIAFDGTNYLVTWSDWPGGGSRESSVFGRLVSPAAVVNPTRIAIATAAGEQSSPTLAWAGDSYLVAWQDVSLSTANRIGATRVSRDGMVLDPAGLTLAGSSTAPSTAYAPALVAGGGQVLLAWSGTNIRAARITAAGASRDGADGFALSGAPNTQQDPAVAFDGTNYLVVWTDSRTGGPNIYGTRVSRQGAILDTAGIRISGATGGQGRPSIAWNGKHYLVVWTAYGLMGARRVAPDGSLPDTADIAFPVPFSLNTDVASNGTDFLIVGAAASVYDIQAYRVSAAGALLDTAAPRTISAATGDQRDARVVFDGTSYFVAWSDNRGRRRNYGARVDGMGAVLDADGIPLGAAVGNELPQSPRIASDGTGSFSVWYDLVSGGGLRGTKVSAAGAVLDPPEIAVITRATGSTTVFDEPRLTFDGMGYVMAWNEARYTGSTLVSQNLIVGPLGATGAAGSGLQVATHPKDRRLPALASDRAGGTLLAYVVPDTGAGFPVSRVRARIFFESAPVNGCVSGSECSTGFCVDGICCDTACGGGVTTDCQACSAAAGAAVSGKCGPVADGRACTDGNACTLSDTCAAGACVGASPVVCAAQDVCHAAGVCAATTGTCSNPAATDGTSCPGGACQAGVCRALPDGGMPDTGMADASRDADATADASADTGGNADTATGTDAGADTDAGAGADASGNTDAPSTPDAPADDAAPRDAASDAGAPPKKAGCGCDLGGSTHPSSALWLVAVVVVLARRRVSSLGNPRRVPKPSPRVSAAACRRR